MAYTNITDIYPGIYYYAWFYQVNINNDCKVRHTEYDCSDNDTGNLPWGNVIHAFNSNQKWEWNSCCYDNFWYDIHYS